MKRWPLTLIVAGLPSGGQVEHGFATPEKLLAWVRMWLELGVIPEEASWYVRVDGSE